MKSTKDLSKYKDITIVPDDFVITHMKTDIVMDCTKDGEIVFAVERRYKTLVQCKDCKYFSLDSWGSDDEMGNIIIAHEICEFWGGGCKTRQDGFCSFGERRTNDL